MRLTILGGGGFRVPLVYRALAEALVGVGVGGATVTDVTLYDSDPARLDVVGRVLAGLEQEIGGGPAVRADSDLDSALTGTDLVFFAIRVGGVAGRVADEELPLEYGLVGQETTGAGGIAYALRTVPVALDVARRVRDRAPSAWVVNFTNPAGIVTQAMAAVLGERVVGICDSPVALCRHVAAALHVDPQGADFAYAGLNHLGWLTAVTVDGVDRLPGLLADRAALGSFEEGRLFGPTLLAALGAVPNEYLHYYYFAREVVAAIRQAGQTRGRYLAEQQDRFYTAAAGADPARALALWRQTRADREATYLSDARELAGPRDAADLAGGGYEAVALAVMAALTGGAPAQLIVNVPDRANLLGLGTDAVVEVPCVVDRAGAHPLPRPPLPPHQAALVATVKACERDVVEAARTGSRAAALRALVHHPLVDSARVADELLTRWATTVPQLHYLR